eukprot:Sdes_comp15489_c0_seq1m4416
MREYIHKFIPGPTSVPEFVRREAYSLDFSSPDLEAEFFDDYTHCAFLLRQILCTKSDVLICTGEATLALWGSLKSTMDRKTSILCVCNGIFGDAIADIASRLSENVQRITFDYSMCVNVPQCVSTILNQKPAIVTMVHCETPSGVLNELKEIGVACRQVGALFIVDFVSSGIGVELYVDKCYIDIGILGSQKVLSLRPDLSILTVSSRAWNIIEQVNYEGYDALLPFRDNVSKKRFPYTMNWSSLAGLRLMCENILGEGLPKLWERHIKCKELCIEFGKQTGLQLYPSSETFSSPTVTVFKIPEEIRWEDLSQELKRHQIGLAGSYGSLKGKVFRIGHMGSQADPEKLQECLKILRNCFLQTFERKV